MTRQIRSAVLLGLLLTAGAWVHAQDAQPRKRPGVGGDASGPLLPASVAEKLNLSGEQKDKIAKLEKEFADKSKDGLAKAREKMEKARADKDRQAMKTAMAEMEEVKTLHKSYASKVGELLNADQKKLFTATAAPAAGPAALSLLPPAAQERLGLSDEQKQKLNQLQKEFEGKALQILTDEQRTTFEQFKSRLQGRQQPRKRPQESSLRSKTIGSEHVPGLTTSRAASSA